MATVTGQSGVVKLNLSGQAEAVVGEVKSFTIDTGNNILEVTKIGDTGRKYTAGINEASVSLDCFWDQADAQQLVLDAGAIIDFEISPSGTASGSKYYSGTGIVANKSISVSFDGMVEATFSITGGTVAEAAHS
jgi:hypothetical protein